MIDFSFIVPTRNRPEELRRFLTSVRDTTSDLSRLEILLGVDEDDVLSREVKVEGLEVKYVTLQPGQAMGWMNCRIADHATGKYIMLQNDDIVARTPGWDDIIRGYLKRFEDEIVLIHVNDLLFNERLCCFPLISRTYCELVGLCPEDYKRYRIDDNIFDIFCLLAYLGERRIVYLPEVVFEHINFEVHNGQKAYYLNAPAFQHDATLYAHRWGQRKQDALKLLRFIQQHARRREEEQALRRVATLSDQFLLRRPELLQVCQGKAEGMGFNGNAVTIGLYSADVYAPRARACIEAIKQHTRHYELLLLDGRNVHGVTTAQDYQSVLAGAQTPYVVLMNDDVLVEAGWLEGLLAAMDEKVGVVVPLQVDVQKRLLTSGLTLGPDGLSCVNVMAVDKTPRPVPGPDGALMLLNRRLVAPIGINPLFKRFLYDLDFGMRVWEAGLQVVCTPQVAVTRFDNGQSMPQELRQKLIEHDGAVFSGSWTGTERLKRIREQQWRAVPQIHLPFEAVFNANEVLSRKADESVQAWETQLAQVVEQVSAIPAFLDEFKRQLMVYLQLEARRLSPAQRGVLMRLSESYHTVELVEPGVFGHHIFMMNGRFVAFPESVGMPERDIYLQGGYPSALEAWRLEPLMQTLQKLAQPGIGA